jgi:thiol-disulfide isomerase/thioredoxin
MSWLKRNFVYLLAGSAAILLGTWLGSARLQPSASAASDIIWRTELTDLTGKPFSLASLKGKPLVINFWATWCGPCKEEMPDFQKLAASELGKSVKIVGIGIDNAANMQSFAKSLGISYTLLEGGAGGLDLIKALGNEVGGLPFTLVIDSSGKTVLTRLGRIGYEELQIASSRALKL